MIPLLLTALAAGTAAAPANPLAPALAGKLECQTPDTTRKTCRSLTAYKAAAGGGYTSHATILLSPSPPVTMSVAAPVQVKDGRVCGTLAADQVDGATISVNGQALAGDAATGAKAQIKAAMQSAFGQEICSSYAASGDGFDATTTLGGKPFPMGNQHGIWVAPGDGYTVAP